MASSLTCTVDVSCGKTMFLVVHRGFTFTDSVAWDRTSIFVCGLDTPIYLWFQNLSNAFQFNFWKLPPSPPPHANHHKTPETLSHLQCAICQFFFPTCPPLHSVFSALPAYRTDLSGPLTPLTTDWFAQCWTIPVRSGTRPSRQNNLTNWGLCKPEPSAESIRVEGTFVAFSFGT